MTRNYSKKQKTEKPQIDYLDLWQKALEKPGTLADCYRLFHRYSFLNQCLLREQFWQRKQPLSPVATFNRWKELGRQVKKGSKALMMCQPKPWQKTMEMENVKTGEMEEVTMSGIAFNYRFNWFALSDTDGEDIAEKTLETPKFSLSKILMNLGIKRVPFEDLNGNSQGYCNIRTGDIAINPLAAHANKTAIHEIAHSLLHSDKAKSGNGVIHDSYGYHECEAESVALIVSSVLGLITEKEESESVGYIKNWMSSVKDLDTNELVKKAAKRVFSAVDKILKANSTEEPEELALA